MAAASAEPLRGTHETIFSFSDEIIPKAREVNEELVPILQRIDRLLPNVHAFEQETFQRYLGVDVPEDFKGNFYLLSKAKKIVISIFDSMNGLVETLSALPEENICVFESVLIASRYYTVLKESKILMMEVSGLEDDKEELFVYYRDPSLPKITHPKEHSQLHSLLKKVSHCFSSQAINLQSVFMIQSKESCWFQNFHDIKKILRNHIKFYDPTFGMKDGGPIPFPTLPEDGDERIG